ncbi:MAG: TlyA family RNA methyltransferase [Candidatus Sungiibacteriota bacterium]|uniref:TlyA family RNA methyltransferase n=1 Tax=Candidatus Sungiibacteriota bacterium TaxID=2750080 RepID=A0A7T5RJ80_9BACT|nr:MAG: TlyA family RNA methyltransferase [Candidatus Sungbacteria bacterium]
MSKRRLDEAIIRLGLSKDKQEAFITVTEGRVLVDGQKAVSPAQLVSPQAKIEIREEPLYVGRGAYKLEAALKKFGINVKDKICADIGAATGGFTQVLLLYGAKRVYAIDTARGKIALKIRREPHVVVMESVDARDIKKLPESVDIVTMDVSLIPLRELLPHTRRFLKPKGEVIALFKPQYETRDPKILRHGVVQDDVARGKLLQDFIDWTEKSGWRIMDQMESPIKGDKGNIEYMLWLHLS